MPPLCSVSLPRSPPPQAPDHQLLLRAGLRHGPGGTRKGPSLWQSSDGWEWFWDLTAVTLGAVSLAQAARHECGTPQSTAPGT